MPPTGPAAGVVVAGLAQAPWLTLRRCRRLAPMPAAADTAFLICATCAGGTDLSTTRPTLRRLTCPGATFVRWTILFTPKSVCVDLRWELEVAPPAPLAAYEGRLLALPAAPPPPEPPPRRRSVSSVVLSG